MANGSYDASIYTDKKILYEIERLRESVLYDVEIIEKCMDILMCKKKKVLDIGCGPGATTKCILEKSGCASVIGIDREIRFIENAKKEYGDLENISFTVSDVEHIPFEDNSVDICFSRYVFQHLRNPRKALEEMIRVTKSGGTIGIYDWDEGLVKYSIIPQNYDIYINAENIRRRFTSGDIYMGRKVCNLFKICNIQDIRAYEFVKDTNNPGRQALWNGQKWMSKANEEHPYVKLGLMSIRQLEEYYTSLKKVFFDDESYVSYTDIFTVGKVYKEDSYVHKEV